MRKLLLFTIILLTLSNKTLAQKKKIIAITAFESADSSIPQSYIKAIENKVIAAFNKTGRFILVDRTNMNRVMQEKELQKSEEFMDGKRVSQDKMQGAEAIVTGIISGVTYSSSTMQDGSKSYNATINLSLRVIDVETGQVLANDVIYAEQSFGGALLSTVVKTNPTKEKAFYRALNGLTKSIDKFVNKRFPLTTGIVQITDAKGGKARKVLLNLGESLGIRKGNYLKVMELKNIKVGNKTLVRKIEIGKLKVERVEGDELSEAKVIKGGKEILAKFNAGAKIACYSYK